MGAMRCPACNSTLVGRCPCGCDCGMMICSQCNYEGVWMEFEFDMPKQAKEPARRKSKYRLSADALLRAGKFRIFSRPAAGEPIWERQRRTPEGTFVWVRFTQTEAFKRLKDKEEVPA